MMLSSAVQRPHRQMAGNETPATRAAEAAPPRKECPVYFTPGGAVTPKMPRSSASHVPTHDGTGCAASYGICQSAAGAGLPASCHAASRNARKRRRSAWGHRPWTDESAGHGAVSVFGAVRGRFLASSLKWMPPPSTTRRPAAALSRQ